jgi:hypothetical protein
VIKLSELTDSDRKRRVIWSPSPHIEKHCILLAWTQTQVILAVPTGSAVRKRAFRNEAVDPREVRFEDAENS